jgi:hypothetical protein
MKRRKMRQAEIVGHRRRVRQAKSLACRNEGLGLGPFVGRSSGIVTAVSIGSLLLIAFGIYKLGRYVIAGSFGPQVQTGIPHAREVFG